jgi:glycosyltransferase involved in cell wall biosynthesis
MGPGGIETLIMDMLRASGDKSCDRIYSLEYDTETLVAKWPLLENYRDRLVGFDRGAGLASSAKLVAKVAAQLKKDRPRIVILHHLGPMLYGGAAARIARIPVIIHIEHDVYHYRDHPKHRLIGAVAARIIRPRHVAISHEVREGMSKVVGDAPITVIPPVVDTERFRPRPRKEAQQYLGLDLPEGAILVGTAARMDPVKAQDLLIKAMAELDEKFHLAIAGDGMLREELENLVKELGLDERVRFLGLRSDLHKIMPAFDIFCLPSHGEGLPRVLFEAQSCDVPVVATDVGAVVDGVCPETGRVVKPGSVDALASGIKEQEASKPAKGASRKFVTDNYGFDKMIEAYEQVAAG